MAGEIEEITLSKDVGKIDVKHFCLSDRLFCDKQGSPMSFNVLPSQDRHVVVQMIKAGGGAVIDGDAVESTGAITISSGAKVTENVKEIISSSYIYVSCFYGELVDMEEFRFISDIGVENAGDKKNDSLVGADQSETRLSLEEMHQTLIYIRNSEHLWKEIEENKVCGNRSWKTIQREFTLWAMKKFHETTSLNTVNERDSHSSDHQRQSMNGCHELNPSTNSRVDINEGPRIEMVHEKNGERLLGLKKGSGSSKSNCKEPQACSSRKNNSSCDRGVCNSEEEDISPHDSRKRVAGRLSAVIDDGSSSESGGQVKGSECGERQGVSIDCEKEVVDGVSEGKEESGKEEVAGNSRDQDGSDCSVGAHNGEISRKMKARGAMSRNISPRPCNEWLRKGETCVRWEKENVVSSTPLSRCVQSEVVESSEREEEAGRSGCSKLSVTSIRGKMPFLQRLYTHKEDMEILRWLCCKRKRSSDSLKGNRIWQFMESRKVIPGRSWQSMRERFRRRIVPNLKDYPIPPEDKKKLLRELR